MDDTLHSLKIELQSLLRSHRTQGTQIQALEDRINAYQRNLEQPETSQPEPSWDLNLSLDHPEPIQVSSNSVKSVQTSNSWTAVEPAKSTEPTEPFWLFALVAQLFSELVSMNLLGPFKALIERLIALYVQNRKDGKLPVFFMGAAGILGMVVAFGFILQYSFSRWLGPVGKIGAGLVVAQGVIVLGSWLYTRRKTMQEYASSLVGLGIILNYVSIGFATAYYGLVNSTLGFGLLAANTALAYALALKFEARVVATLAFVGGALMPFLLPVSSPHPWFYLAYLLVLSGSAVVLSRKIAWAALARLAFLVSVAIMEYAIFEHPGASIPGQMQILGLALLHGFAYLFVWDALFANARQFKPEITRGNLTLAIGSLALLIYNLFWLTNGNALAGGLYLANALLIVALFLPPFRLADSGTPAHRALMMSVAGAFAALVPPSLLGVEVSGLFWGLEALLLIHMGLTLEFRSVRREGYVLLLIALGQLVYSASAFANNFNYMAVAFVNLAAIGVLLYSASWLFKRLQAKLDKFERTLSTLTHELTSLWAVAFFLLTLNGIWPAFVYVAAAVPLFYLLYRNERYKLPLTLVMAIGCYALVLFQAFLSINAVQTMHFMSQTLYGKIAYVEAFVLLWLFQWFYERTSPKSTLLGAVKTLRLAAYLMIPVLIVPPLGTIFRRVPEYLSLALWGSVIASFVLARWIKHPWLRSEYYLLNIIAIVVTIGAIFLGIANHSVTPAVLALLIGLLVSGAAMVYWRRAEERDAQYRFAASSAIWYFMIAAALGTYLLTHSLTTGFAVFAVLALMVGTKTSRYSLTRPHLNRYFRVGELFVYGSILTSLGTALMAAPDAMLTTVEGAVALIALSVLYRCYRDNSRNARLIRHGKLQHSQYFEQMSWWILHSCLLIGYLVVTKGVTGTMAGPVTSVLLVLHAIALMLQALSPSVQTLRHFATALFVAVAIKILWYDMADFSMIQKAVAFAVMGAMLLAGAYRFQQLRTRGMAPS